MTQIKSSQRKGKASLAALTVSTGMLDIPVMTQIAQADSMYNETLVRSGNGLAYSEQIEDLARSGNGLATISQYEDLARSGNGLAYGSMVDVSANI